MQTKVLNPAFLSYSRKGTKNKDRVSPHVPPLDSASAPSSAVVKKAESSNPYSFKARPVKVQLSNLPNPTMKHVIQQNLFNKANRDHEEHRQRERERARFLRLERRRAREERRKQIAAEIVIRDVTFKPSQIWEKGLRCDLNPEDFVRSPRRGKQNRRKSVRVEKDPWVFEKQINEVDPVKKYQRQRATEEKELKMKAVNYKKNQIWEMGLRCGLDQADSLPRRKAPQRKRPKVEEDLEHYGRPMRKEEKKREQRNREAAEVRMKAVNFKSTQIWEMGLRNPFVPDNNRNRSKPSNRERAALAHARLRPLESSRQTEPMVFSQLSHEKQDGTTARGVAQRAKVQDRGTENEELMNSTTKPTVVGDDDDYAEDEYEDEFDAEKESPIEKKVLPEKTILITAVSKAAADVNVKPTTPQSNFSHFTTPMSSKPTTPVESAKPLLPNERSLDQSFKPVEDAPAEIVFDLPMGSTHSQQHPAVIDNAVQTAKLSEHLAIPNIQVEETAPAENSATAEKLSDHPEELMEKLRQIQAEEDDLDRLAQLEAEEELRADEDAAAAAAARVAEIEAALKQAQEEEEELDRLAQLEVEADEKAEEGAIAAEIAQLAFKEAQLTQDQNTAEPREQDHRPVSPSMPSHFSATFTPTPSNPPTERQYA